MCQMTRQLFLDNDGVLADFDTYAEQVFGLPSRQAETILGTERFWADLKSHPDFYRKLPLMPDALLLYEAVKHWDPIILTGCPAGGWAEEQKLGWRDEKFPGVRMITCMSKDKRLHMKPGDVLVDDWPKYRTLWEEAGGIFILYKDLTQALVEINYAMAE